MLCGDERGNLAMAAAPPRGVVDCTLAEGSGGTGADTFVVHLHAGLRIPPTPEDGVRISGSSVWCRFAQLPGASREIEIGQAGNTGAYAGPIVLLSSGNGHAIGARRR